MIAKSYEILNDSLVLSNPKYLLEILKHPRNDYKFNICASWLFLTICNLLRVTLGIYNFYN